MSDDYSLDNPFAWAEPRKVEGATEDNLLAIFRRSLQSGYTDGYSALEIGAARQFDRKGNWSYTNLGDDPNLAYCSSEDDFVIVCKVRVNHWNDYWNDLILLEREVKEQRLAEQVAEKEAKIAELSAELEHLRGEG